MRSISFLLVLILLCTCLSIPASATTDWQTAYKEALMEVDMGVTGFALVLRDIDFDGIPELFFGNLLGSIRRAWTMWSFKDGALIEMTDSDLVNVEAFYTVKACQNKESGEFLMVGYEPYYGLGAGSAESMVLSEIRMQDNQIRIKHIATKSGSYIYEDSPVHVGVDYSYSVNSMEVSEEEYLRFESEYMSQFREVKDSCTYYAGSWDYSENLPDGFRLEDDTYSGWDEAEVELFMNLHSPGPVIGEVSGQKNTLPIYIDENLVNLLAYNIRG